MDWQSLYERLSNESTEVRELDQRQFLELKATIPKRPKISSPYGRFDRDTYTREIKALEWLNALLKFNELLRETQAAEAANVPAQNSLLPEPRNREEGEQLGYVMANDVLTVFADKFPDQATLTRFLERLPHIRTFKPSGNRKMVHGGDLIRHLATMGDEDFDRLDRDSVEERKEELKKKRSQPRK